MSNAPIMQTQMIGTERENDEEATLTKAPKLFGQVRACSLMSIHSVAEEQLAVHVWLTTVSEIKHRLQTSHIGMFGWFLSKRHHMLGKANPQ
eukprot:736903-Amphidinium_carterae.1